MSCIGVLFACAVTCIIFNVCVILEKLCNMITPAKSSILFKLHFLCVIFNLNMSLHMLYYGDFLASYSGTATMFFFFNKMYNSFYLFLIIPIFAISFLGRYPKNTFSHHKFCGWDKWSNSSLRLHFKRTENRRSSFLHLLWSTTIDRSYSFSSLLSCNCMCMW